MSSPTSSAKMLLAGIIPDHLHDAFQRAMARAGVEGDVRVAAELLRYLCAVSAESKRGEEQKAAEEGFFPTAASGQQQEEGEEEEEGRGVCGEGVSPSPVMDALWHAIILDTALWRALQTDVLGGTVVDHFPDAELDEEGVKAERRRNAVQLMRARGYPVNPDIWDGIAAQDGRCCSRDLTETLPPEHDDVKDQRIQVMVKNDIFRSYPSSSSPNNNSNCTVTVIPGLHTWQDVMRAVAATSPQIDVTHNDLRAIVRGRQVSPQAVIDPEADLCTVNLLPRLRGC